MMVEERFLLAAERLRELQKEKALSGEYDTYFKQTADFLGDVCRLYEDVCDGKLRSLDMEELGRVNRRLYEDILPENYGKSYSNPEFSSHCFGSEYGKLMCFLASELRSVIPFAFEGRLEELVIRLELFLEVYVSFCTSLKEDGELLPADNLQEIFYYYVSDYTRDAFEQKLYDLLDPASDFALRIVEGDLSNPAYLYYYGEYVTENEIAAWRHLMSLDEETLQKMADTCSRRLQRRSSHLPRGG